MATPADLAQELLKLARDDEVAVKALLDRPEVADAIVGFHAQQAVEKSLKAILAARAVDYPFSHDLDGLVELCRTEGLEPPDGLAGVEDLPPYGVAFRYGTLDTPKLDRGASARFARVAVAWAAQVTNNAI